MKHTFLHGKRKWLQLGFFLALLCILGYGLAIYQGWLRLNHPSIERYPIRGVDVSHYQGVIDWQILSREGISFAYIKATEGSCYVDDRFSYNWEQARQTTLAIGAYHFFSFESPAQTQLQNFTAQVQGVPAMLPPVIDIEFYGDTKDNPPDKEMVRLELQGMLDGLEAHYHRKPILYATEDTWEFYLKGQFDSYPLWIRNVFTTPRLDGADWFIWQYTNRGKLNGYKGKEEYIDLNVFSGDEASWKRWLEQEESPDGL